MYLDGAYISCLTAGQRDVHLQTLGSIVSVCDGSCIEWFSFWAKKIELKVNYLNQMLTLENLRKGLERKNDFLKTEQKKHGRSYINMRF